MLSLLFVSVTFLRIFHPVKSPRVILLGVPSQQVNACFTIKTFAACMQCYLHFSGYRAVQYLSLAHSHSLSVSLYAVFVVGICYVFMDFSFSKIPYNRVILWDTQLFPVPPTPTPAWGHHVYIQFNDSVLILNLTILQSLNFFSHFFINKISQQCKFTFKMLDQFTKYHTCSLLAHALGYMQTNGLQIWCMCV